MLLSGSVPGSEIKEGNDVGLDDCRENDTGQEMARAFDRRESLNLWA
jgi:hypothetical protein